MLVTRATARGWDWLALVKVVLVLLRLLAAASSRVQLVANATEKATAGLLLARGRALYRLLIGAGLLVTVVAAGELVDVVHDVGCVVD